MKKIILAIFICAFAVGLVSVKVDAAQSPNKIPASVAPAVNLYRDGNYIGALQFLDEVIEKEPNNVYAKYYLALCHTRLGHEEKAEKYYKEVIKANSNAALVFYSKKAAACLDDPESDECLGKPEKDEEEEVIVVPEPEEDKKEEKKEEPSDIVKFIQSGQRIHPAALDAITRERMQRKLEKFEYDRRQNPNLQSNNAMPTNEEIAAALNTLSKIGMNPYQTAQYQYNPYMLSGNNSMDFNYNPYFGTMLQNNLLNTNPETAKMLLYTQMLGSQNGTSGFFNYGM